MTGESVETKEKLWNSNYIKVWIANFTIFFSFMLLTPLLPLYLNETFGADKHTIGIVLSGYTLMALITRTFSGWIVDSFPRKAVLIICFTLFSLFFIGYIAAGSLFLFGLVRTLHGAPFGATTVSNSTIAIDVLHPSRRAEGIGYYGMSNNIATAISPAAAIWIYQATHNFDILFVLSMIIAALGMIINCTVKIPAREIVKVKQPLTWDRFFLRDGWRQAIALVCLSFGYGVISTYVAIYGKKELGIESGAGLFFALLAIGLGLSRILGSKSLAKGLITRNASIGVLISVWGYMIFAILPNEIGYYGAAVLIGLGNGHMFPAFQTMFINLAPNSRRGTASSSLLVSWDIGIGLGCLSGGILSEYISYFAAFLCAWLVNVVGVIYYFAVVKAHYNTHKIR